MFGSSRRGVASASAAFTLPPVVDASGAAIDDKALRERLAGKRVGFYFSAGWCGMCTSFEPSLDQFRKACEESGKPIELINVSSDRSEKDALARAKALGMMTVKFDGSNRGDLKKKFSIWAGSESFEFGMRRRSGVPAIVVLNPDGDETAFVDAERSGAGSLRKWPLDEGVW